MVKKTGLVLLGVVLLLMSACSNEESSDSQAQRSSEGSAGGTADTEQSTADQASDQASNSAQEDAASERMVIHSGSMTLEVEEYDAARSDIETRVNEMGGYIVESSVQRSGDGAREGSLSVRIPQEQFSTFMTDMEGVGTTVLDRSTKGEDVTEEYVDLESRLRSKETQEERLTAFMEEAANTDALLQISEDLSAVQEEIEKLKGRMNYLENHSANATVDITLQERGSSSLQSGEDLNTWERSTQLFTRTLNGIVSAASGIAVFFVGLSPVLVPMLLLAAGTAFYYRKKRKHEE
ncbi:DUF4349 domain-containing protein [Salibacterium qingdaonense]|uniref:DUF4349 domain-containing protein n=1 Tax=Salibacterium qingdaonense TaxID=266892 RepID=A0A1I4LKW2_9BACI|nr:DUF4349 domain-containing protein [Salibacterium qingdaonense]SFL91612.1 protein of unknown function [Salibacterium qingdaonense]